MAQATSNSHKDRVELAIEPRAKSLIAFGLRSRPRTYSEPKSPRITSLQERVPKPLRIISLEEEGEGVGDPLPKSPIFIVDSDTLILYYRCVVSYN
jgi:hypothetical protein